ncbi:glycosyltransferase [Desulfococcaceae bacterium HSG7]|nr:glycosyltransferase [Desulfococcaceae bacterium HSG7]
MRIIHISSADNKGGGARSAYRLHASLRKQGVDSRMFVKSKYTQDDSVVAFEPKSSAIQRIIFRLRRRWETGNVGYFSANDTIYNGFAPPSTPFGTAPLKQLPEADIVSLNWVAGFWDYRNISHLPKRCKAVVWRLSDMNPFTGGCFYDNHCGRFIENCGKCPCLQSHKSNDLSWRSVMMKKSIIEALPPNFFHIVAQSRWIEKQIKVSNVFKNQPVIRIPNGIDTQQLQPQDSREARIELGVHPDHAVVLFVAQFLSNPRKGGAYFVETLKHVAAKSTIPITVLALGQDTLPPLSNVRIIQIKDVKDNAGLARCYSAADVYVITSLQDNLPNTVLESMACGTPVVGFEVGGVPDMVINGETGFLVPLKDTVALAQNILNIIQDNDLKTRFARKCRERIMKKFSLETQTQSYINLYERLLHERKIPAK